MALDIMQMLYDKNELQMNVHKEIIDENSLAYANTLRSVGFCYYCQGNWETALSYYFKSLEINDTLIHLSQESILCLGKTKNDIGVIYHHNRSNKEALPYYQYSLIEKEKAEGKFSSTYAKSFFNIIIFHNSELNWAKLILSLMKFFNKKNSKADELKKKTVEKFKLCYQENILEALLGKDIIDAAKEMRDLNRTGKYFDKFDGLKSVIGYFKKVLSKIEETIGMNSECANFYYFLAELFRWNMQKPESIKSFKKALDILGSLKMNNDLLYALVSLKLGKVLSKLKIFYQALENYETSLRIYDQGERNNNNVYLCLTLKLR